MTSEIGSVENCFFWKMNRSPWESLHYRVEKAVAFALVIFGFSTNWMKLQKIVTVTAIGHRREVYR